MSCREAIEPRILVIGYGNPLRGDDGAGWQAAERLDERLRMPEVRVYIRHQLTPELAEAVSQADWVVFIDASCVDPPGELACCKVEPAGETAISLLHEVNAQQLIGSALALYGRSAEGVMYSIGGESFDLSDQLTPRVQRAVDEVVEKVERHVRALLGAPAAV